MAKRLAKFVKEVTDKSRTGDWCSEAQCKEYPEITRRVHIVRFRGKYQRFNQYFVEGKKYLGYLDGFPSLPLAIRALKCKE